MQTTITIPDTWGDLPAKQAMLLQQAYNDYVQDKQYPDYVAKCVYILTDGAIVPGEYHMLPGPQQRAAEAAMERFKEEQLIVVAGSLPASFAGYEVPQSEGDYHDQLSTKLLMDCATFLAQRESELDVLAYETAIYMAAAFLVSKRYGGPNQISETEALALVEQMAASEVLPVGFFLAANARLHLIGWEQWQDGFRQTLRETLAILPASAQ